MIKKSVYTFYLMLFSPALALMLGLKEKSFQFKRVLLILFITFYGSTIVLSEGQDGLVHLDNVNEHYLDLPFVQFIKELIAILKFAPLYGTNDDVYIHALSYFVGGILGVPQLFFVFVSFIYAYFFSGSILKVAQVLPQTKISFFFYFFSVIFILQKNIEGINTVRTWTGFWILFYAAFSYFETRKTKYLLLLFIPPFVHVAYFIMAIPAWGIALFGSRFKIVYVSIFVSSFFVGLNQNAVMKGLSQTEVGESKAQGYYVEDEGDSKLAKYENATWYRKVQKYGLQKIPIYIIVFTLIFSGVYFKGMNVLETNLFSIGILTMALSNFSVFLYALNARTELIASVFIYAAFLLLLKRGCFDKEKARFYDAYQIIFLIATLFSIPFIIFKIADLIYYISFFMLSLPFIPWLSNEFNFSIRDFLAWLL